MLHERTPPQQQTHVQNAYRASGVEHSGSRVCRQLVSSQARQQLHVRAQELPVHHLVLSHRAAPAAEAGVQPAAQLAFVSAAAALGVSRRIDLHRSVMVNNCVLQTVIRIYEESKNKRMNAYPDCCCDVEGPVFELCNDFSRRAACFSRCSCIFSTDMLGSLAPTMFTLLIGATKFAANCKSI